MTIRLATSQDVPIIDRLYLLLVAEMAKIAPGTIQPLLSSRSDYFKDYIEDPASEVFVSEQEDNLNGFALVVEARTGSQPEEVPHHFAFLIDIMVDQPARHHGIGQGLFDAVQQWSKKRQLEFVQLNVLAQNEDAMAFYQKNGFKADQITLKRPL